MSSIQTSDVDRGSTGPHKKPRRIALLGDSSPRVETALEEGGFQLVNVSDSPDLIITYGGDGSLIGSDRDFPNIPKLPIRRCESYQKCEQHKLDKVIAKLQGGTYQITQLPRLTAEFNDEKLYAINDIVFHNSNAASAVRYSVTIDGIVYSSEIVGDGVVVATPFGSSAYYRSITNSVTRVGIGLAFNNSTESTNHLVLNETSEIEIRVLRGPASVLADNFVHPKTMTKDDKLIIRYSRQRAELWELDAIICKDCKEIKTGRPAGWRHV